MSIRKSGAFRVVKSGLLPRAGAEEDLFGARGLLPTLDLPTLSIPGVGDLTSVLGLPGPDTSTTSTSSTTSVPIETTSNTIPLTTSDSATSTTPTSTLTSTSTSTTASSTTTSDLTSTTPLTTTSSDTPTSTPTPTTTSTTPTSSLPPTVTVTSSDTAAPAATSQADGAPKSFLQNKALSVGVITAATLVGIVLIIALATWAVRRRRKDRIDQDIIDFSNVGLVNDTEKGGAGGFGAIGGNVETSSTGSSHSGSLGHGNTVPPSVQSRQMYQDMSYGAAAPYGMPSRQASNAQQASPYNRGAYGAYPSNTYQLPSTTYNATYNNWGYGYSAGAQYDQAYGSTEDAHSGYTDPRANVNVADYSAGAQQQSGPLQRRPSAQRKPAPQLDLVSGSTTAQPLATSPEPISGTASAAPPPYPKLPAPGPLPDQFGASLGSPMEHEEPRRLVVRND